MIIERPLAYIKLDKQKDVFDKKAFIQIVENTVLPIEVFLNFDLKMLPVGRVIALRIEHNALIGTIEMASDIYNEEYLKSFCFRLSGTSNSEKNSEGITSITDFEVFSVGMLPKGIDVYDEEDL